MTNFLAQIRTEVLALFPEGKQYHSPWASSRSRPNPLGGLEITSRSRRSAYCLLPFAYCPPASSCKILGSGSSMARSEWQALQSCVISSPPFDL